MRELLSQSLKLKNEKLFILDQTQLPQNETWVSVEDPDQMITVIKNLQVRGAPLIGVSASLILALWSRKNRDQNAFEKQAEKLKSARPTAVNLMNNIDHLIAVCRNTKMDSSAILEMAFKIFDEDVELCLQMAKAGASLIDEGDSILTHCNTGGLATVGLGTALGVIIQAHREGKKIHVYVDETRPLLQGGRLTAWELMKAGVPHTLICDSMSAFLMKQKKVHKVFVGADRIAMNGDFANKIGTYNLAVLCHYHKLPFYVVAPQTTVDIHCEKGDQIPVEIRKEEEVRGVSGAFGKILWAPSESKVYNPAFDITPSRLLTGAVIGGSYLDCERLQSGDLKKVKKNEEIKF